MEQITRRGFFVSAAAAASGCIGGNGEKTDGSDTGMELSSMAFEDGENIPTEYTCDGANSSPPLRISGVPEDSDTLAVIVDDPDAPGGTFVHWSLWNLPAGTEQVPQSVQRGPSISDLGGAVQGTNDADEVGYSGPCPPEEDGPHKYRFFLHAVGEELEVEPGAERGELETALEGSTLSTARPEGSYER